MEPKTRERSLAALEAGAIVLGSWLALGTVLGAGWIWDDGLEVTRNPLLRDAGGLLRTWIDSPGLDYFPLKTSLQWVEWHLWGFDPAGYHAVNLALHIAGAFLLWRVLGALGVRLAWLGGLLFAVHPLAVESVAWVSELKNVLSLPLVLLSFLAYLKWDNGGTRFPWRVSLGHSVASSQAEATTRRGGRAPPYIASVVLFLAAMLCKTSVVMFPFVLLLHAWWKRGRVGGRDVLAAAPFLAVSLGLGLVTLWFQVHRAIVGVGMFSDGLPVRAAMAGKAVLFYAAKTAWPSGLLPIYPRWDAAHLTPWQFWPWPAIGAVFVFLWRMRRADWARAALFGAACFILSLVPVLGFLPMAYLRISRVADHFAYLALACAAGLAAAALSRIPARAWPLASILVAAVAAALVISSRAHAGIFRDEKTLWTHELQRNPDAWLGCNNLGIEMQKEGRIGDAIPLYERALRLRPDFAEAHNNFGVALADSGRVGEAMAQYERAIADKPDFADPYNNEGNVLFKLGRMREALDRYSRALRINPDYPEAQNNLANALFRSGRVGEAIPHYRLALRMNPDFPEAHSNLGAALAQTGRMADAIAQYREVLRLRPDFAEAHNNLGVALEGLGRLAEAAAEYRAAIRLQPTMTEARDNLERIQGKPGNPPAGKGRDLR